MRFLSVRELRAKSADVWKELSVEKEMVVTNNGKPVAVLTPVEGFSVEESLAAWRQVRASQALNAIHQDALKKGLDGMSMEEIDAEVSSSRKSRNS